MSRSFFGVILCLILCFSIICVKWPVSCGDLDFISTFTHNRPWLDAQRGARVWFYSPEKNVSTRYRDPTNCDWKHWKCWLNKNGFWKNPFVLFEINEPMCSTKRSFSIILLYFYIIIFHNAVPNGFLKSIFLFGSNVNRFHCVMWSLFQPKSRPQIPVFWLPLGS